MRVCTCVRVHVCVGMCAFMRKMCVCVCVYVHVCMCMCVCVSRARMCVRTRSLQYQARAQLESKELTSFRAFNLTASSKAASFLHRSSECRIRLNDFKELWGGLKIHMQHAACFPDGATSWCVLTYLSTIISRFHCVT